MSSPPPSSAPLAGRLAWLAGEVRSEKEEAGMIVALFIEVFARLLSRLAGIAARLEAGTLPPPCITPFRAPTAPVAAPVTPGLLPRLFGWLGGLSPMGGAVALPAHIALSYAEQPRIRTASLVSAPPRLGAAAEGSEDPRPGGTDTYAERSTPERIGVQVPPSALPSPTWSRLLLAACRLLPASTRRTVFESPISPGA